MSYRKTILDPLIDNNPVTLQILGICSALAVTRELQTALIMGAAVIFVLAFSNVCVSAIRTLMPRSIRLILEVTLIATAVIVVDEVLKAYAPDTSRILTVFVGLIVTNCIVLGRVEAFAMHQPVGLSLADGVGNGLGYSLILIIVGGCRELLGAGTLLGVPILPLTSNGGFYEPIQLMLLPPSAFFIIGIIIWAVRSWRRRLAEQADFKPARLDYQEGR